MKVYMESSWSGSPEKKKISIYTAYLTKKAIWLPRNTRNQSGKKKKYYPETWNYCPHTKSIYIAYVRKMAIWLLCQLWKMDKFESVHILCMYLCIKQKLKLTRKLVKFKVHKIISIRYTHLNRYLVTMKTSETDKYESEHMVFCARTSVPSKIKLRENTVVA